VPPHPFGLRQMPAHPCFDILSGTARVNVPSSGKRKSTQLTDPKYDTRLQADVKLVGLVRFLPHSISGQCSIILTLCSAVKSSLCSGRRDISLTSSPILYGMHFEEGCRRDISNVPIAQTSPASEVLGELLRQYLDGHLTAQVGVLSPVHLTHASLADLFEDFIMGECLANHVSYRWGTSLISSSKQLRTTINSTSV